MSAPAANSQRAERGLRSVLADADRLTLSERFGERVAFDAPLGPHTSWKIGGPADALVAVETTAELATVLELVRRRRLPWFVLGSGSNLLIGDGGIRGVILRLTGEFSRIAFEPDPAQVIVRAGASASLALLTGQAASRGAVGIGSLAGIPGSVGGSLRMNAGTDQETGNFVREVWVQTPSRPRPHAVSPTYFYRRTSLARDAIVAEVVFAFERGEPAAVRTEMKRRLERRKASQPLQFPNAGSCFRNPPGDSAGRLIEAAGAKGWREGNAEVSELHANFIVNRGDASAKDVAILLARTRRAVTEQFGIELEFEVHFVGVFIA